MSNAILVIDQVQIRRDAEGRYCLNDLHRASAMGAGKAPSEWKKNKSTDALIEELEKQTREIPPVTVEGCHGGTFVAKELVYAYAMWVSPAFHLKVINAYDALVTGQMNMQTQARLMDRKALALMVIEQEAEIEALTHEVEYQKDLVGLTADAMLGPAEAGQEASSSLTSSLIYRSSSLTYCSSRASSSDA